MIEELDTLKQIEGIGINCTPPQHVSKLLESVKINSRYVVVYANKGENWDSQNKQFIEGSGTQEDQYAEYAS